MPHGYSRWLLYYRVPDRAAKYRELVGERIFGNTRPIFAKCSVHAMAVARFSCGDVVTRYVLPIHG